ncbi:RNB domain-containing ribonuclease [Streptomyces sp. NPDC001492]
MPRRPIHVTGAPESPLLAALAALRAKFHVPADFPPEVLAAAEQAAKAPVLPEHDATDIPLFTIDPPGSTDLDQAMHLSRQGSGYRVHYAIADVAAFVVPGGPVDEEAHRRVTTLYFPDLRVPLHPFVLSEGAASLLPDQTRPAALWTVDLDANGRTIAVDVHRALVRSRARYDYEGVQAKIDAGTAEEPLALLKTIGLLREQLEIRRGGISLRVPEQEITERDHSYELSYRAPLAAEGWNEQISLLTGMAAAELMLAHGTGILRTQAPTTAGKLDELRRTAHALRIEWPHHMSYAQLVRSLDPGEPRHAAFLQACTGLMTRAEYTVFQGGHVPQHPEHAAVAAPYAHCTAPLRRLADRYATEICLAAVAGREPPGWVLSGLESVRQRMAAAGGRAGDLERKCVDLVEAALLKDQIGKIFEGVVVEREHPGHHGMEPGIVQLASPAVIGDIMETTQESLGERRPLRLEQADMEVPTVSFALA